MGKCLYDQWCDGVAVALNNFTVQLFKAFQVADGVNKAIIIIIKNWPELFENSENI